jgi:hypothetical protein
MQRRLAQFRLRQSFPFRLARGAEILTLHALKSFRGSEETEATTITHDDAGRFRPDFDDVRIRHLRFQPCRLYPDAPTSMHPKSFNGIATSFRTIRADRYVLRTTKL